MGGSPWIQWYHNIRYAPSKDPGTRVFAVRPDPEILTKIMAWKLGFATIWSNFDSWNMNGEMIHTRSNSSEMLSQLQEGHPEKVQPRALDVLQNDSSSFGPGEAHLPQLHLCTPLIHLQRSRKDDFEQIADAAAFRIAEPAIPTKYTHPNDTLRLQACVCSTCPMARPRES
ncbi:hypothetical protein BJ508DRAFT_303199 [Ascobolus immersus RN42]|uniref:Uncharacterized protein n=1 Tax=Ascobolus immersus RN42 TaxID=1160509 RepID=A0A3N4IG83_ASCIM|nr:hypothetical protein BJ508DRAFT_303199 [Ascobolus immersus RN42]